MSGHDGPLDFASIAALDGTLPRSNGSPSLPSLTAPNHPTREQVTHHLLIAHGSPDPRHKAMMRTLAGLAENRGLPCSATYLEHDSPSVPQSLVHLQGPVVTLGMLLAPEYHATVDVPAC